MNPVLAAFIALLVAAGATETLNPQLVTSLFAQAQSEFPSASPSSTPSAAPSISPTPSPSAAAVYDPDHDGDNDGSHHHRHHHPRPSPTPIVESSPTVLAYVTPTPSSVASADASSAPAVSYPATSSPTVQPSYSPSAAVQYTPEPRIVPTSVAIAPGPVSSPLFGAPSSFAQLYSASSPLRTMIANQPHRVVQAPLSISIWNNEGFTANTTVTTGSPIYYSSSPSDRLVTIARCTMFGGNCAMAGKQVHINPADVAQSPPYDQHIAIVDPALNEEIDCWETSENADNTPDLSGGTLKCGWGGYFPLGSMGVNGPWFAQNPASNGQGIAMGVAMGLVYITPRELLAGAGGIQHAGAWAANCMDAPSVYPSDNPGTDKTCDGGSGYPHYGDAIQYVGKTDAQIAASPISNSCKAVLTMLHDYGAYFSDTGNGNTDLGVFSAVAYRSDPGEMGGGDPYPLVFADLARAAQGSSDGWWHDCLDGLSNSDFQLDELTPPQ